ncbi:MAG: SCO family protein [Solirubrobacteraceae bacterium]|jgi:protein SCO1
MRPRPRLALLATATVLVVALAAVLALSGSRGGSPSPSSSAGEASGFDGAALPSVQAPGFTLTDQHGRRVSLGGYRGRVVILAFLYTTCGSSCVVIAQQIRGALDELAQPPAVLFVSVDPSADTPARVSRFLAEVSLGGRVLYLSGSETRLRQVWRAYHITPASSGKQAFERYAAVLLLDRRGRERVLFQMEQLTPESIAHDTRKLQEG